MRALSEKRIRGLIVSLYAAAEESSPESWAEIYGQLVKLLAAGPGSLSFYSPGRKRYDVFVSTLDAALCDEYNDYYQFVSPLRRRLLGMKAGERLNRAELLADGEFRRTEIYADYFRRLDVFHYEHRVLFRDAETTAAVTFTRPARMRNFDAAEQSLLAQLMPHLEKAFQIHSRFSRIRQEKEVLAECFDRISQGLAVLGRTGKVIFMNDGVRRLVAAKDGLQTGPQGILTANAAADTRRLKVLLAEVFAPAFERPAGAGGMLEIARRSGRRPLSVFVAPFAGSDRAAFGTEPRALLFVNDPERAVAPVESVLGRLYGLTPAESKIAALLVEGRTVNDVSRLLGIKPNTTRTHLKRIFSKTETGRQSELIKVILNNFNNVQNLAEKFEA